MQFDTDDPRLPRTSSRFQRLISTRVGIPRIRGLTDSATFALRTLLEVRRTDFRMTPMVQ